MVEKVHESVMGAVGVRVEEKREEGGTFGGFEVGGFGLVRKSGCREWCRRVWRCMKCRNGVESSASRV